MCPTCGTWINEDYNVEHYEECAEEYKLEKEEDGKNKETEIKKD